MNLISSLQVKQFRGFVDSGMVNLTPLTFFVGPNSSGKSSLLDSVLLIAQSNYNFSDWMTPQLMGRYVDLGSFEDAVYKHDKSRAITIELGLRMDRRHPLHESPKTLSEFRVQWTIKSSSTSLTGRVSAIVITDVTSKASIKLAKSATSIVTTLENRRILETSIRRSEERLFTQVAEAITAQIDSRKTSLSLSKAGYKRIAELCGYSYLMPEFFSDIERVSSDRAGPRRWFPKSAVPDDGRMESGVFNDPYTMSLENQFYRKRSRRRLSPKSTIAKYLADLGIATTLTRDELSAYHTALKVTDSVSHVRSNLADVGFGASQAIPVIRGCISDSLGALFIEQPEIHLHPRAQSQLANLICETSKERQVFVETHSEHLINRARILVAEGRLKADEVSIIYVDRAKGGAHVTRIGITKSGDFEQDWPEGFFDERYRDSMQLLKLKSKAGPIIDLGKKSKT